MRAIEKFCELAERGRVGPRNKILFELVGKLDHMHDDLVALLEWARAPRTQCYPEAPPEPRPRSGA